MTAIAGTLRLVSASTKQLVRSGEVYGDVFLSLMDLWVTGAAVLAVALGNGHAFLALIATYKSTGVLKRISVTPISPGQLILGEIAPRAVQGAVIFIFFLAAGRALGANVRIEPGVVSLIPIVVLVAATGLSIPFIIAGLTKTPADARRPNPPGRTSLVAPAMAGSGSAERRRRRRDAAPLPRHRSRPVTTVTKL